MKGYIYLGFDHSGYCIKVGKSKNWEKRQEQIRHMNPTFTVFLEFLVDDVDFVEKQLHKHLSEKRIDSEWFDLTGKDIAWIAETLDGIERNEEWINTVSRVTGVRKQ